MVNYHVWGVVSSRGTVEVHQCVHESCGKFRVIGKDADEDRLYTYSQLMAAYPDIEWVDPLVMQRRALTAWQATDNRPSDL